MKPQRRATSPSPAASPSFSLFPSANVPTDGPSAASARGPSRLQRSYTVPGAVSPNQPTFEGSNSQEETHIVVMLHTPTSETAATLGAPNSGVDTSHLTPASSSQNLAEQYHEHEVEREEASKTEPLKPRLEEPAWEMMMKPGSNKALPRSPGDAKHEVEALISSAAEASIARQISVSQRQLLLPIVPKSERLVDRQPLTPQLVESRKSSTRKSHWVQIESD